MRFLRPTIAVLAVSIGCTTAFAQAPQEPVTPSGPNAGAPAAATMEVPPVPLEWAPPALAQLSAQALAKSSFTLDRTMLAAAAGMMGNSDAQTKAAIQKLDGVSVHLLRFADAAPADPALVDAVRNGYHLQGWKHVVNSGAGPVHDSTTDIWVVMDGVNLRGAVVLVESPKSLTLATVAGNLSPVDLLHLRGHFGIPKFDEDGFGHNQIQ
jgi:hypothetical protein